MTRRAILAGVIGLVPTGCSGPTEPLERVVRMEVAEVLGPCHDAHRWRECLQTREQPSDPWRNFFWPITGFTYEPGFHYVLRVGVRQVEGEYIADGGSERYRLVKVESKTPVP
jgi:hypothetical protein